MAVYHPCGKCEISFDFCRCEPIKQKNGYMCGPVAIRNSCWVLGIEIPDVNKIAKVCGTDKDGTSVTGLRRGAKFAGLKLERIFISSIHSVDDVFKILRSTKIPIILGYTVADEGHYCVVFNEHQITPGMGGKYELIALNWNHDTAVAFDSHSNLLKESVITREWLVGKLLAHGTDIYLVSKG